MLISGFVPSNAQEKTAYLDDTLNGRVNTFTETEYIFNQTYEKQLYSKLMEKFDPRGNIIEMTILKQDSSLTTKRNFKHNNEGKLIEMTNAQHGQKTMDTYDYDIRGYLKNKKQYQDTQDFFSWEAVYKYDVFGNQIEINELNHDGSLYRKTINKYDKKKNKKEEIVYLPGNVINKKSLWKYDNNNNIIEYIVFGKDHSYIVHDAYKYDNQNNQVQEIEYKENGAQYVKVVNKYDKSGNKIEERNFYGDAPGKITFYKYDEAGNMLNYTIYASDGNLYSSCDFMEEAFDKANNWLRRTYYTNKKMDIILEREIEYYK